MPIIYTCVYIIGNKQININKFYIILLFIKIQMHVPIQLPCYDLIKITNLNIIKTFKIIKIY